MKIAATKIAAAANYLEAHPESGEWFLPTPSGFIRIYSEDGIVMVDLEEVGTAGTRAAHYIGGGERRP